MKRTQPLRVLQVAAEILPLIKTSGLADVVGALPPALAGVGVDTRVVLPGNMEILQGVQRLRLVATLGPFFGAALMTLRRGHLPGNGGMADVIDAPFLCRRTGDPYVGPDGHDWPDNHRRFALLGWIAADLAAGRLDPEWAPNIVHAHDRHAGLTPAYIAQNPALRTPTVFTIHNLAYRGPFPLETFTELQRPAIRSTVAPTSRPRARAAESSPRATSIKGFYRSRWRPQQAVTASVRYRQRRRLLAIRSRWRPVHRPGQPVADRQCQRQYRRRINVVRADFLVIEDDDLAENRHVGGRQNDVEVQPVFLQVANDVDEHFDGDQDGHEGAESGENVADFEQKIGVNADPAVEHIDHVERAPEIRTGG
jgi:hypothetical protein